MSWSSFINVCCGQAEEQIKYGAFIPNEDEKDRIQRIEEKVTLMNRHLNSEVLVGGGFNNNIRGTIACKAIDMTEYLQNYQPPSHYKSEDEMEFLVQVLNDSLTIVLDLEDSEVKLLASAMEKETVPAGTTIFKKGDDGDFYYIVGEGEVLVVDPDQDDDGNFTTICQGEAFGELALL
jgi:hypothetical protein